MRQKANKRCIDEVLYRLNVHSDIEPELLGEAFYEVLSNKNSSIRDVQMGSLLTGVMAKGPKADDVITLLESAFKVDEFFPNKGDIVDLPEEAMLVGQVGSGKKGYKTMNISTPAMIIAATAGAYTVKLASSSTSSITGSADLLRELGVNMNLSTEEMKTTIKKTRFGAFCIENIIPKFDSIYSGRFYAPHALSFGLAPLTSPIKYDNILYGLAHPNVELSAKVLKRFGVENAMIVSSSDDGIHYLDELGVYGTTRIIGIRNGKIGKLRYFDPIDELGLPHYFHKDIAQGKDIKENVKYCVDVLSGKGDKAREDIVCINAGTVLYLADLAEDLREGYELSKEVVETGSSLEKLLEVINVTRGDKRKLFEYME